MAPTRPSGGDSNHVPLFSLAEAIPADPRHGHTSESKFEHFQPGRWFGRHRTVLSELPSLRCRGDWSETLVRASSSARQHLGALVKLGPQVRPSAFVISNAACYCTAYTPHNWSTLHREMAPAITTQRSAPSTLSPLYPTLLWASTHTGEQVHGTLLVPQLLTVFLSYRYPAHIEQGHLTY